MHQQFYEMISKMLVPFVIVLSSVVSLIQLCFFFALIIVQTVSAVPFVSEQIQIVQTKIIIVFSCKFFCLNHFAAIVFLNKIKNFSNFRFADAHARFEPRILHYNCLVNGSLTSLTIRLQSVFSENSSVCLKKQKNPLFTS